MVTLYLVFKGAFLVGAVLTLAKTVPMCIRGEGQL